MILTEGALLEAVKCLIVKLPSTEVKCFISIKVQSILFGQLNTAEMKDCENIGMNLRRLIIKKELEELPIKM
ncbi:hypothetical protein D3C85_1648010 [compost metagenome]